MNLNHSSPDSCIDPGCSVATFRPGICQIYVSNGLYLCGCCTTDELKCVECGGDVGGGICLGLSSVAYQGCACSSPNNNDTGGGVPPPILLPVPPPLGFILPPPGTPMREDGGDNCPKPDLAKCSECRAIEAWCQEGENVRTPRSFSSISNTNII